VRSGGKKKNLALTRGKTQGEGCNRGPIILYQYSSGLHDARGQRVKLSRAKNIWITDGPRCLNLGRKEKTRGGEGFQMGSQKEGGQLDRRSKTENKISIYSDNGKKEPKSRKTSKCFWREKKQTERKKERTGRGGRHMIKTFGQLGQHLKRDSPERGGVA